MSAGTGGNPELGEQAAQESLEALSSSVGNADMVCIMLICIFCFFHLHIVILPTCIL